MAKADRIEPETHLTHLFEVLPSATEHEQPDAQLALTLELALLDSRKLLTYEPSDFFETRLLFRPLCLIPR